MKAEGLSLKAEGGAVAIAKRESWIAELFPSGVPIRSRFPEMAQFVAERGPIDFGSLGLAYTLDETRCDLETLRRVAVKVVEQCGGGTSDEVLAYLLRGEAMPIRFDQVAAIVYPAVSEGDRKEVVEA